MKNLTCDERIGVANSKIKEVLKLITETEHVEEIDFDEIIAQILDIHRDELKLISLLREYENRDIRVKSLDLTGLDMVNQRGA